MSPLAGEDLAPFGEEAPTHALAAVGGFTLPFEKKKHGARGMCQPLVKDPPQPAAASKLSGFWVLLFSSPRPKNQPICFAKLGRQSTLVTSTDGQPESDLIKRVCFLFSQAAHKEKLRKL